MKQKRFMRMVKAKQHGHDVGGSQVSAAAKSMKAGDVQEMMDSPTRAPVTPARSKAGMRKRGYK